MFLVSFAIASTDRDLIASSTLMTDSSSFDDNLGFAAPASERSETAQLPIEIPRVEDDDGDTNYLPYASERASLRSYDALIRSGILRRWQATRGLVILRDLPPELAWANNMFGNLIASHQDLPEPSSPRRRITVTVVVRHPLTGTDIPVCPVPVSSLQIILS